MGHLCLQGWLLPDMAELTSDTVTRVSLSTPLPTLDLVRKSEVPKHLLGQRPNEMVEVGFRCGCNEKITRLGQGQKSRVAREPLFVFWLCTHTENVLCN